MGGCDRGDVVDEPTGTPGGDAAVRLTEVKAEAVLARERAAEAARRARELAGGAPPDPVCAEERSTRARTSLVASLRSAAEAHRRAARTHLAPPTSAAVTRRGTGRRPSCTSTAPTRTTPAPARSRRTGRPGGSAGVRASD